MEAVTKTNILDSKLLQRIESLCTQEEPPACSAACPVHVDAKQMIAYVAAKEWDKAFLLYSKTVAFPEVVAHVCDAPCQKVCRRNDRGGAIKIEFLEKSIVRNANTAPKPILFLPKKTQTVAVIGGGIKGMACAGDLAKKGYKVTIYEKEEKLGGSLWEYSREELPEQAIKNDVERLLKLPIIVKYNEEVCCKTEAEITNFLSENVFDAVFIACETGITFNDVTLETPVKSVFAGRRSGRLSDGFSAIYEMYDGRSASLTIDRFIQNVSIMVGREKDGSHETALFTNIENVENAVPSDDPISEAERCLQCTCLECVKKCSFMQNYGTYPKKAVREVYNNLSIAMGIHHSNEMINSCSLCGNCGAVCPNGLDLGAVILAARERMVETGKMPPSTFEFGVLDMEYSLSDEAFLVKNQIGYNSSKYLFFPGCQLGASSPETVKAAYSDLCENLSGGVGLMLSCCGVMAHWAGQEEKFLEAKERIAESVKKLGNPEVITACPTCMSVIKGIDGIKVSSIYSKLNEIRETPKDIQEKIAYAIHDACGARNDSEEQEAARELAKKCGAEIIETESCPDHDACCGYGGLMLFTNRKLSDKTINYQIEKHEKESANKTLTYCINCRDRYLTQNKEASHVLELLYGEDEQKIPTWSSRQENRKRLKLELLNEIWGENLAMESGILLTFMGDAEQKLEERMILRSDVEKTIINADKTGHCLKNPENGRLLSSFRPQNVTFWVEYEKKDGGYNVHNVYSHRMSAEIALHRNERD